MKYKRLEKQMAKKGFVKVDVVSHGNLESRLRRIFSRGWFKEIRIISALSVEDYLKYDISDNNYFIYIKK